LKAGATIIPDKPTYRSSFCERRVRTFETGLIDGESEPEGSSSAHTFFHFVTYFAVYSAAKPSPRSHAQPALNSRSEGKRKDIVRN